MNVISGFTGEYEFLSNFYPSKIVFERMNFVFPTAENVFQACKYKAMRGDTYSLHDYVAQFESCSPSKAKYYGRSVSLDVPRWNKIKNDVMREVVFQKFLQNVDLKDKLLGTGSALLVETNDWNDTYWGRCNGRGYNILGAILMEVRGFFYWSNNA